MSQILFACRSCGHRYQIPLDRIPAAGMKGPCKNCGAVMGLYPDGRLEGAISVRESAPPPLQEAPSVDTGPPPIPEPDPPVITRGPDIPPAIPQASAPPFEFHCPNCGHAFRLDLRKLPPEGGRGACSKCSTHLMVYPDGTVRGTSAAAPEPEPGPALLGTGEENAWMIQAGGGETLGPFALQEMKELVFQGRLPADRVVKTEGLEWAPAAAFAALAPLFTPEEAGAPGESIGSEDDCYAHPDHEPARRCSQCQRFLCEECLKPHRALGTVKPILLCTACGGTTAEVKKRQKWIPFYRDMAYVLKAPFSSGHALMYFGTLIFLQCLKVPCGFSGIIGWMGIFILTTFQFSFFLHVTREVAGGSYEIPEWPDVSDYAGMMWDTFKVILLFFWPILAYLAFGIVGLLSGGFTGGMAVTLIFVLLIPVGILYYLFYLPICLAIFAIFNSIMPAMNPLVIGKVIVRIGPTYFLGAALWLSFFIIDIGTGMMFSAIPIFGNVFQAPIKVYCYILIFYTMGRMAYENEEKIGWY